MLLDLCVIHELYKENKIKITFQKSFLENILGLENIVEAYRYPTKFYHLQYQNLNQNQNLNQLNILL